MDSVTEKWSRLLCKCTVQSYLWAEPTNERQIFGKINDISIAKCSQFAFQTGVGAEPESKNFKKRTRE